MGEICIADFCCNHADRERSGPQEVLRHLHLFCHNKIFELDPHLLFKKAREVVRIQIEFFCDLGAPDIPLDMVLDILDDLLHLAFEMCIRDRGMADRVMVMCEGRVTGFLDREEADSVSVMRLATKLM